MYDHQLYLRTLSEFARALLMPYDVQSMLEELTRRVTAVLGLHGSGVCLADGDQLAFDLGLGGAATEMEKVQEETQTGPCVAAFRSGKVVSVPDLSAEAERWPAYCAAAERVGIRAVASIPMRLGARQVGVLDLYADEVRPWDEGDRAAAVVMADMATAFLINASAHQQQVQLTEQLQSALDSRVLVEQAKGMLAARHDITPDEAFDRLRRHARRRGAAVHAVAEAVVSLGLDVDP